MTKLNVYYMANGFSDGEPCYDEAECPNCGYHYDEDVEPWGKPFCPECGTELIWYLDNEVVYED